MAENSVLNVDVRVNGGGDLDKLANSMRGVQGATDGAHPAVAKTEDQLKSLGGTSEKTAEAIKAFGESVRQHIETPVGTAYVSLGKLAEHFGIIGVAAASAVGVFAAAGVSILESAKRLGELGTELSNVSIRTGLSTEQVSLFSFAARAAGSDIQSFEMAMKMFSRALSDNSDEGKKAKAQLDAMGIATRDIAGVLRPIADIFEDVSDGLNKMSNRAEQATAAQNLFSRAGIELLPTLLKLRENIEFASAHNIEMFGADKIAQLEEYHKRVLLIEDTWGKIWHNIAGAAAAAGFYAIEAATGGPQMPPITALGQTEVPGYGIVPRFRIESTHFDQAPSTSDAFNKLVGQAQSTGTLHPITGAIHLNAGQYQDAAAGSQSMGLIHLHSAEDLQYPLPPSGIAAPADYLNPVDASRRLVAQNAALNTAASARANAVSGAGSLDNQITQARKTVAADEASLMDGLPGLGNDARTTLDADVKHLASLLAHQAALEAEKLILAGRAAGSAGQQSAQNALLGPASRILAEGGQHMAAAWLNGGDPQTLDYLANQTQFQLLHLNQEGEKVFAAGQSPLAQAARGLYNPSTTGPESEGAVKVYDSEQKEIIKTETEELKHLTETLKETTEEQKKMAAAAAALQEKRDENVKTFSNGLFDALVSGLGTRGGTGGAVGAFFKHQGLQQASDIFQNLGKDVAPAITGMLPNIGADGGPGGLLKHTLFSREDPATTAAKESSTKLSGSAAALSKSASDLSAAASVLSGGRVGGGQFSVDGEPNSYTTFNTSGGTNYSQTLNTAMGGIPGMGPGGYSFGPDLGGGSSNSFSSYFSGMGVGGDDIDLNTMMGGIPGMGPGGYSLGPSFGGSGGGGGGSSLLTALAGAGAMGGGAAGFGGGGGSPSGTAVAGSLVNSVGALSKSFGSAAALGASNPWATLSGGSVSTGAGTATTGSALGVAGQIGAVGALTAAGFGVFQGATDIAKGGAYGIIGGVGKVAGSLAAIDPEPISKAILGSIAMTSAVIDAIMGDPRMQRQTEEAKTLKYAHYFAPQAINETESTGGTYSDQGRGGFVRNSPFSPTPQIQQSYADWRNNTIVPGRTISQFSQQPAAASPNITIQAIDSQSVAQFTSKYSDALADGIVKAVGQGHTIVPQMRDAMMGTF